MKRLLSILLTVALALTFMGIAAAEDTFRIGIVTGSADQAVDDLRGAEAFQAKYGKDRVILVNYPDSFTTEREKTIQSIAALADDPNIKAVIANQAVPGTAEAFQLIKERRPDILCLAGQSHEDLNIIAGVADLVIKSDFIARGYLMIRTAHELGCDTFVHISFPRHRASEAMRRRLAVMQEACAEFGMRFVDETAPDPTIVGTEEAQAFIMLAAPEWIAEYGQNAAYFCTNDAHTEPLLRQLLAYGGYFIEADLPSPLKGYPEALGLDLTDAGDDFVKIQAAIERAVCEKGGAGRFGTWTYSYGYTLSAGLAQHAYNVIKGESKIHDLADLFRAFQEFTPGANWNGSVYTNADKSEKRENVFLIYQDTYIMGDPGYYMGEADVKVPEKYFLH